MDKVYYPDKETVVIKACLIHPFLSCVETFTIKDIEGFAGTKYGLCTTCLELKTIQDGWEDLIKETIVSRLKELRRREEEIE